MKTSKLIEIACRCGYQVDENYFDEVTFYPGDRRINFEGDDFIPIPLAEVSKGSSHYMFNDPVLPQLAHAIIDYANTPVEERNDDKRWNVVIGQDIDGARFFSVWRKSPGGNYIDTGTTLNGLKKDAYIFTDSEFDDLVNLLKSLPNGETYAKIAELGKREVKP